MPSASDDLPRYLSPDGDDDDDDDWTTFSREHVAVVHPRGRKEGRKEVPSCE